ncbi:sulfite exporter TauE/SafE family protein [Cyanobium sp. Morenito 9A2]|uniref:sulfite exporter TauE/SafE family protein n=1 Tax=Cyanobium sp. Morenito 9A2 TaxID=2823718 RepID=UPI0020CBCED1|nr:sulfite exporter TauE/SafE family protein [Cyanobium sp. Morenito 9A2]MCP9849295.1 sulfite exporter TauE/SafE family protein [Cyanobium sp. Morenito 9A2]
MPWDLLPLLPLGILAGLLSGVLGIGGGLVFSPLLLVMGLDPHQAMATSTLAILPTTLAGTSAHLRSGSLPPVPGMAIGAGALMTGWLFSHVGSLLNGWQLLGLQALVYLVLAFTIQAKEALPAQNPKRPLPLGGLAAVGLVAGFAGGLLGVGGGLVMVPLMVRLLNVPIHLAIRFSTLAVFCSASGAAPAFLGDGRGQWLPALLLGGTAAFGAHWSAARLNRVSEARLVWLLRLVAISLALDSGRRALNLVLSG